MFGYTSDKISIFAQSHSPRGLNSFPLGPSAQKGNITTNCPCRKGTLGFGGPLDMGSKDQPRKLWKDCRCDGAPDVVFSPYHFRALSPRDRSFGFHANGCGRCVTFGVDDLFFTASRERATTDLESHDTFTEHKNGSQQMSSSLQRRSQPC